MEGIKKRIFFWHALFLLIISLACPLQALAQGAVNKHDNWPVRKAKCEECQDAVDKYNDAANKFNKVNDKIRSTSNAIESDKKGIKQANAKGDSSLEQSLKNDLTSLEDKLDKLEFELSDIMKDVLNAKEDLYECEKNCKEKPGKPVLHDNWPHKKAKCEECKSAADEYNKAADKYNKVNNKIHSSYDAIESDKKGIEQAKAKGNTSLAQTLTKDMKQLEENVDKLEFQLSDLMGDVLKASEKLSECESNCNKKLTLIPVEPQNHQQYAYHAQPAYSYQSLNPRYAVTIGGKYQQYSDNGTNFASSFSTIGHTTSSSDFNVHQDYHFGYNLGLAYFLPYKGSSLNLDYSNLNATDSRTITGDHLTVEGENVITTTGQTKFSTGLFNLTLQQLFALNPYIDLTLYGGLNYTHITKDMVITADRDNFSRFRIEAGTSFNGIGPVFGIDAVIYPFTDYYHRIGVVGDLQGLFPYGKLSGYLQEFEDNDTFTKYVPSEKVFLPGTKAKLGLRFDVSGNGQYILDAGYEAYISSDATKTADYSGMTSNISYRGIYLNLNILEPIRY